MSSHADDGLTTALDLLRSNDVLAQNEGVAAAIASGDSAVPALLSLLDDANAGRRAQAMYALARIGAHEAATAFQRGLDDADERVRAYAALGLVRINHPDALTAIIRTLNDAPDQLHLDVTPAVGVLSELGLAAVSPLLDALLSEDQLTRLRAQRALEGITNRRHGFATGQGFPTPEAEAAARAEWRANGPYDHAADAATRAAAVARWRRWLATVDGR